MMERPVLKPTSITNEQAAKVTYHIEGELIPAVTVEINPSQSVFFEHHVMLWKSTTLVTSKFKLNRTFKRALSGMPIILLEASGEGKICFSRNSAGQVYPIHLEPGQSIHVREHQYLAATTNLNYTFKDVKEISNVIFGGTRFFIDQFQATDCQGIVWLHGYGNVFEKILAQDEQIDIDPGAWVYKDPTVTMKTKIQRFSTGFLAGKSLVCNRFTGPGRIGIQSHSLAMESDSSRITKGKTGLIGFLFGWLAARKSK